MMFFAIDQPMIRRIFKVLWVLPFLTLGACFTKMQNPYQSNGGLPQLNSIQFPGALPRGSKANQCRNIENASIISNDGTFLGIIGNKLHQKSIFNSFGLYGSKFSQSSIWNKFGQYGGEFSQLSPFNRFSQTPPKIVKNNQVVGLLTVNKSIPGGISPYAVVASCRS